MSRLRPIGHEDRLSLVEHLDELRNRLIACVVVFMVAFSVAYWQNGWLLETVNKPLESTQNVDGSGSRSGDPLEESAAYQLKSGAAQRLTIPALAGQKRVNDLLASKLKLSAAELAVIAAQNRQLDRAIRANRAAVAATPTNTERQPVTLGVTEPFVTTFTVAAYAALLLALPFILFQAYAFVLPAFSPSERKVALPRAIDFLQNFNDDNFDILIRAADYYKFSVVLMALIGLMFQIPVGVLAVTRLGLVTARQLAHNRGYIILGIAVVAAVATPTPDPVTMIVAMAPLLVLFELSIVLARIFERRRAAAEPDDRWDLDDDLSLS